MPDFASTLGIMIGLGVGIDYALFIVTRFRENLHKGHGIEASTLDRHRHRRPGRAVRRHHRRHLAARHARSCSSASSPGLAIGAAVVVAMTMVASLTLLPALLGFAGERVEVTRWRGLIAAGLVAVALVGVGLGVPALIAGHARRSPSSCSLASFAVAPLRKRVLEREPQAAARDARLPLEPGHPAPPVDRRRSSARRSSSLLALPILGLRLGFSDEGNYPEDTDHPPGLRPAGRGLRARASTAR